MHSLTEIIRQGRIFGTVDVENVITIDEQNNEKNPEYNDCLLKGLSSTMRVICNDYD